MSSGTNPIDFPVPDFSDLKVVWGADRADYLTREQLGDDFYSMRGPFCEAAETLFFRGGNLAALGLEFKPGINHVKAMRAIRALLASFQPKHEIKIGTVGFALSQWCVPALAAADGRDPEAKP